MILGKLLNFFSQHFPLCTLKTIYILTATVRIINVAKTVEHLTQFMAHTKHSINVNYFDDTVMMVVTIFLTSEYIKRIILKQNYGIQRKSRFCGSKTIQAV